jgi:serine/threonine protein phosphatase PrpC
MQAIGVSSGLDPQMFSISVRPGDIAVACTDGVWKEVGPSELGDVFGSAEPAQAVKTILARAVASHDNATLVVAAVH